MKEEIKNLTSGVGNTFFPNWSGARLELMYILQIWGA